MSTIPTVDFGACNIEKENVTEDDWKSVGREIKKVFSTWGFVYLKNTGIYGTQVDRLHQVTEKFFTLSMEEKMKYSRYVNPPYGYGAVGDEMLLKDGPGDFKELFDVPGDRLYQADLRWPAVPQFSNSVQKFMEASKALGMRVLTALSSVMDFEDFSNTSQFFLETANKQESSLDNFLLEHHKNLFSESDTLLRLLYYPVCAKERDRSKVRLGEHTDYGTITLLFQGDVEGLQVKSSSGEFVDALPVHDTVVVNIADMLQEWTNGELKSTLHRVSSNARSDVVRRSTAFFIHPHRNTPVRVKIGDAVRKINKNEIKNAHQYTVQRYKEAFY